MFWRRKDQEQDLERELLTHLDAEAAEQQELGLSPEEARYAARRAFGNKTLVREEVRELWRPGMVDRIWQDVRYAIRMLGKNPVFAAVAVLSLALGIGANSAIFSLVDGLWMRPMAVTRHGEIVRLFTVTPQNPEDRFSYPEYLALKDRATAFQGLIVRGGRGTQVPNADGTSELHTVNVVSDNFFDVLGIQAQAGRVFTPKDTDLLNHEPVVVLGNSFWKRRFGSDLGIVGKRIEFQRGKTKVLFRVLGVLPETFREINNSEDRDLWLPIKSWVYLSSVTEMENRGFRWFRVLGRLSPGVSVRTANAQVEIIARRLAAEWAESNLGRGLRVVSDLDYRLELAGAKGIILFSAVLLLVLLSSVNVANLLLARGTHRAKEIGIRLALGAHRSRIIGQLATENILLGIAGLVGGLALGAILIKLLPSLLVEPPALQPELNFYLDSRVLCFSIFVSLMTTLLFGLLPAWNASKSNLGFAFKERLSSAEWSSRRLQPRHWLSVSQIGVSFVLLVGTSLLIGSFLNTRTLDYGITRRPLLDVWVSASGSHVPVLYREALNRLQEVSSVKAIAFASRAPLSLSEGGMSQLVTFPERSETASQPIEIKYNSISSNYLDVMGTRLIAGRAFNETDQTNGPAVALISETMAHRFWGSENPIDKVIRLNTGETEYRIVGVVQDTPINELSEVVEPYIYLPYWRNPTASMTFLLRTAGNPLGLAQSVRQKLVALSHELEPQMTTSQRQLVDYSAGPYQMTAELVSTLGLLGLLLTAVGLYGVISYGVTQRTREIGIRMALGAERSRILRLVLREVTLLGAIGLLVGLPLALFAAQSASAVLFGLSPLDVASFCTAVVPLLIVLFAAGAVPARRAARVDPMIALRYE